MKYLFIDIRKSDEVYSKRFEQQETQDYTVYTIPMNMVRFNTKNIVQHLQYVNEIYIVCHTTSRSRFIKNKYFKNNDRIKVSDNLQFSKLEHGINHVVLREDKPPVSIKVAGSNFFNYYNVMRITQTIMGILMLSVGIYTYTQLSRYCPSKNVQKMNTVPLFVLIAFGFMALFNGLTSTCSISVLLQDYLN